MKYQTLKIKVLRKNGAAEPNDKNQKCVFRRTKNTL